MHKTDAGKRRKELQTRALKLAREAKAATKAAGILAEASHVAPGSCRKRQTGLRRKQRV